MIFVSNEAFKDMLQSGFIKQGDFSITMKHHSKAKRHKHYVREDKYAKYLRYKTTRAKKNKQI